MNKSGLDPQVALMSCLLSAIARRYSRARASRILSGALSGAAASLRPQWGNRANADTLLQCGVEARRKHFRVKDLRKDGKYYPVRAPVPEAESLLAAVEKVLSETRYEEPLGFQNRLTEYFCTWFSRFNGPPPGDPPRKGAAMLSTKAAYGRPG